MLQKVFCVFDSKVGAYMTPFFQRSTGEALRSWIDAVNQEKSNFGLHAEDYTLFELGTWDDETAQFKLHVAHVSLGKAIEFLKEKV